MFVDLIGPRCKCSLFKFSLQDHSNYLDSNCSLDRLGGCAAVPSLAKPEQRAVQWCQRDLCSTFAHHLLLLLLLIITVHESAVPMCLFTPVTARPLLTCPQLHNKNTPEPGSNGRHAVVLVAHKHESITHAEICVTHKMTLAAVVAASAASDPRD